MRALVRFLPATARILLGLVFTVFGVNFFLHFLPTPPMAGPAGDFAMALGATGYMFPLIKVVEISAGLMLLSGRLVPLALVLLAPIIVNIALFHLVFTPGQAGMAVVLVALEIFLAWAYRDAYRGVLDARARPRLGAGDHAAAEPAREPAAIRS